MKKIISMTLVSTFLLTALLLTGCFGRNKTDGDGKTKLGLGVYSYYGTPTDADGDVDGECEAVLTAAAVFVGIDGKIKKCVLDCASNKLSYTSDGKYVKTAEFKTKRELGDDYGMTAGGAAKEWYEQADVFESLVKEKTLDEVKKLAADGGKGTDEVIKAGCTISVSDFIMAIERAVNSAKETDASEEDELKLSVVSTQTGVSDATEEEDGANACDSTFFAALLDDDGVVTECRCDSVHAEIAFDEHGEEELEDDVKLNSKRELGDNYGMTAGGAKMEWYEQADAFERECRGKNAAGIVLLESDDGYGIEALQTAGCTIKVTDLVKAAVKAVK